MPPFTIRSATPDDAAAIAEIYAPFVTSTAISFETEPPDADAMRARIVSGITKYPWLVADDGRVVGYAYASQHRSRAAYRWSVDVSVYVHASARRRGIASELYRALFASLKERGFMRAFAGIALPNEASVGLHEALGFTPVGVYHAVGYKLGAWRDVGWWELALQPLADPPPEPR